MDFEELSEGHQQVIAVSTQRASVIVQAFLLTPERRDLVRERAGFVPAQGATSCPNEDLLKIFHQKLKIQTFGKNRSADQRDRLDL